jgi:prepilin-type N-terminal cleavage/methylation domain-containing protein
MPNFKFQISNFKKGFTLIELMVVVSIMAILATAVIINIAGQRNSRNIAIAENDLVTNIRTAQSYTLSSRTLPSGQAVQYYVLKFDFSKPTQYTLQAIYNVSSTPQLQSVQTFYFPSGIVLSSSSPMTITGAVSNQTISNPAGCGLVIFSAPFGKTFFNNGCTPKNPSNPYTIGAGDDYEKPLNYVTNVSCAVDPSACTISDNSVMVITINAKNSTLSKTITINGITGAVSFN